MCEELISIIVPVYNVYDYLDRCVKSLTTQTYQNIEIILVDDGSSDDSGKLCDLWRKKDSRIVVIHKKNGGLSDARNAGINIAKGKYYSFIDSDDYITNDTIEKLYVSMKENKCDISICNMKHFNDNNETFDFYIPTNHLMVYKNLDRFKTLNQPSVCNKLFRASLFVDIRFPKGKYFEDTYVYHELLYKANSVVLTGHDGYWYYIREGSISYSKYTDKYFDFVEAVYLRMTYLIKHNVSYYSKEAALSLYAAVANSEKYIIQSKENKEKFKQMRKWYKGAYVYLMKYSNIGLKQKIRLVLLKYFPYIHSKLF